MKKKSKSNTLGYLAKTVFKTAGGLDIVSDLIDKVAVTSQPLIEKVIDNHQEKIKAQTNLPNVTNLSVIQGKEYLEKLGFHVVTLLAQPQARLMHGKVNEIVSMDPKPGKVVRESLVKLYYLNDQVISASQETGALVNVTGIEVQRAQEILRDKGLMAELVLMKPHRKYRNEVPNVVLDMVPKPSLILKKLKPGTLVKLRYIDQEGLQESKVLAKNKKIKDLH